jgi:hypothetical protein
MSHDIIMKQHGDTIGVAARLGADVQDRFASEKAIFGKSRG